MSLCLPPLQKKYLFTRIHVHVAEGTKISYLYKKGYFVNFQLTLFSFVSDSAFQVVTEELMGGEGGGVGTEEVRVGGVGADC